MSSLDDSKVMQMILDNLENLEQEQERMQAETNKRFDLMQEDITQIKEDSAITRTAVRCGYSRNSIFKKRKIQHLNVSINYWQSRVCYEADMPCFFPCPDVWTLRPLKLSMYRGLVLFESTDYFECLDYMNRCGTLKEPYLIKNLDAPASEVLQSSQAISE